MKADNDQIKQERAGVTATIEVGARVLLNVMNMDLPASLSTVAQMSGLLPSRTHRHLSALVAAGFVVQGDDGKYDLGHRAMEIGLTAVGQADPVRKASSVLADLTAKTNLVAALLVWGTHGPTVIRSEYGRLRSYLPITEGRTLPLLTSASGKIFLSYLPDETTASLVAAEFDGLKTAKKSEQGKMVRKICDEVRRRGMATSEGTYRPHTNIAVPIFDHQGKLVLSISLLGLKGSFSTAPEAPIPMALKTTATELSRRLGARI